MQLESLMSRTFCTYRSSHRKCYVKKSVCRDFVKFIGKHLSQSTFFNKVEAWNFIKKETLAHVFSCEFCKISKNTFLTEHLWTTASIQTVWELQPTVVWSRLLVKEERAATWWNAYLNCSGCVWSSYVIYKPLGTRSQKYLKPNEYFFAVYVYKCMSFNILKKTVTFSCFSFWKR